MEKLPQYSSELINELDWAIRHVEFPMTLEGIEDLSERKLRRLAFAAGQRALVDDLISLLSEDRDGNRSDHSGSSDSSSSGWDGLFSGPTGEGPEQDER